ncbi:MAG: DUF1735 domain-containing protein [Chryseolinea sp.]
MKKHIKGTLRIFFALFISIVAFSCLDDKGYTDIINSVGNDQMFLSWYGADGKSINKAVALPAQDTADYTVTVSATSAASKLNKEVTVIVAVDAAVIEETNALIENAGDKFFLLPDSTYVIETFSVTIDADTTEAPFVITFYQNKIDKSKNYMLPLTIQDQDGALVGSNTGTLKLTFIGNPLAGARLWDFYRYNCQNGAVECAVSTNWQDDDTAFSPVDGLSLKVPTGYYVQPNYLITFKNEGGGVLSNFKAVIAPDEIDAAFTANGIAVVDGPHITVNADYSVITINYTVFNGSAYRNLTDIFHK